MRNQTRLIMSDVNWLVYSSKKKWPETIGFLRTTAVVVRRKSEQLDVPRCKRQLRNRASVEMEGGLGNVLKRALLKSGLTLDWLDWLDCRSSCAASLLDPPRAIIRSRPDPGGIKAGRRTRANVHGSPRPREREWRNYRCWQLRSALYVSRLRRQLSDLAAGYDLIRGTQGHVDVIDISRAQIICTDFLESSWRLRFLDGLSRVLRQNWGWKTATAFNDTWKITWK